MVNSGIQFFQLVTFFLFLAQCCIILQATTLMRRRSGGLHCPNDLDIYTFAERAHSLTGIFYDDRTNKAVMNYLKGQRKNSAFEMLHSNPELNSPLAYETYSGFDYGLESQFERQERQQLQKKVQIPFKVYNIAVIANSIQEVFDILTRREQNYESLLFFELYTERYENNIIKYWIFDRNEGNQLQKLKKIYINRCDAIIEYSNGDVYLQKIVCERVMERINQRLYLKG